MQDVTGTLSPGAHAGSYNGQDAYNDMLVVEDESLLRGKRTTAASETTDKGRSVELYARSTGNPGMGGGTNE